MTTTTASRRFERARRIADAVLLEGYVLYPYRASAAKNRFRWSIGALAPRAWSEEGGCEPWWLEAQCLVEPRGAARIEGRLRFLQVERRRVERAVDGATFEPVGSLEAGGRLFVSFDEAQVREVDFAVVGPGAEQVRAFEAEAGTRVEPLPGGAGRLVRERLGVGGRLRVALEPVPAADGRSLLRLRVRVENETPWADPGAARDEALRAGCIATHLLLSASGAGFVSLLDPPGWARAAAAGCRSVRCWPVLAGEPGRDDLALAAPIILYDHPQLAPESPGDFFDATEIDELLTLRTSTLTPEEKREARATDPRAAAILDRVEGLSPQAMGRLHGARRDARGPEMTPRAPAGATSCPGARVRLRPGGRRRTDAQDLLYAGLEATVREVRTDVDGRVHLAVTIDADPAAELHDWYGRYHYYALDEVEPLEAPAPGEASP